MPSLTTLVDGTIPVAADFNGNYQALNNAIGSSTTISTWAIGEMPYASATDTLARLAPGSVGKVLTMTSTIPNWEGGAWSNQAFSAGDFTASGSQTWTVASGDVILNTYQIIGKTMNWSFVLATTTVGGTPSTELRITLPGGKTAAKTQYFVIKTIDNNGAWSTSTCKTTASGTFLSIFRDLTETSNWSASTDLTYVRGTVTLEIT